MKIYSFDPKKQKQILCGVLTGDTLHREVSVKHFMRIVDGYGIQYGALTELASKDVKHIVIIEKETGKQWQSTLKDWQDNSKTADYGHGKQVFLSMKYMHIFVPPKKQEPGQLSFIEDKQEKLSNPRVEEKI